MNKRKYEEQIIRVSKCYQRIGMWGTFITWVMFALFYEPRIERPAIWLITVVLQFLAIGKLLEYRIPIRYADMPHIPKSKETQQFAFWGALLLLMKYESVIQNPLYLVVYVLFIWGVANLIYHITQMY